MVLSEYWKRLGETFQNKVISTISQNDGNYKKYISSSLFQYSERTINSLVQKQTIHQQKALDLSSNLTPWKWVWHYQEGVTPSRRKKHRSAWGKKSCSTARGHGSLMIMPRPLLGCKIKAEIKGFLLRHCLFQYKHWFYPIFEFKDFPELNFTPWTVFH